MQLDYDLVRDMPEHETNLIGDAAEAASDGAALLAVMLMAMRELRVDEITVAGVYSRMASLSAEYAATQGH